jgi:hypothetical protein
MMSLNKSLGIWNEAVIYDLDGVTQEVRRADKKTLANFKDSHLKNWDSSRVLYLKPLCNPATWLYHGTIPTST